MTSISVGGEQQIDLVILNLEETAKGSGIMFMHKYTFPDWPQISIPLPQVHGALSGG